MEALPTVIVLAAGRGSRFGAAGSKLAQPLAGGSVLAATLREAIASGLPVLVVTTAALEPEATRQVASRDIVVVPEAAGDPQLGIGYSIAAGVQATPHAGGWLVLPGDMPLVRAATLLAVARALASHPVAYAQYGGRRGHPVGFAAELYSELVALRGDEGARRVVARYPALPVAVDDPGVLVDVDTEADLASVRAQLAGSLTS